MKVDQELNLICRIAGNIYPHVVESCKRNGYRGRRTKKVVEEAMAIYLEAKLLLNEARKDEEC